MLHFSRKTNYQYLILLEFAHLGNISCFSSRLSFPSVTESRALAHMIGKTYLFFHFEFVVN